MPDRRLTKSAYLQGLQCAKLLWFAGNTPGVMPSINERTQAAFDQGHEVGQLAQALFPDGLRIDPGGETARVGGHPCGLLPLLRLRRPLFEPALHAGSLYARADILAPVGHEAWDLVEVKSGTFVKDPNLDDVAFQLHCGREAGLRISACSLMHVNGDYVRRGGIDPAALFTRVDVTAEAEERLEGIAGRAARMLRVLGEPSPPEVGIGPQCSAPYECPLVPLCWAHVHDVADNVFSLARIGARAWRLYEKGILRTDAIPAGFRLSEAQRIQIEAERTGVPHVDRDAVRSFLDSLRYPLHLLDFETFQAAIPRVEGTRPYQQVPFQFSLHVIGALRARPEHVSWLWDNSDDPLREMLEQLRAGIGSEGSIVSYNAGFETARIEECVDANPGFRQWWRRAAPRVVDLYAPFRAFAVYFPSQHGSASMKQVLPAISGRGYEGLAIQDGAQASSAFMRITFGSAAPEERARVRRDLEEYCGLDTLGMRDIIQGLHRLLR
jgi:hypothetical protein